MNEATLQYALAHADDDVRQLALRGCKDPLVNLPLALQQIEGRQKARRKLPAWAANDGIVYPAHLALEQCSSEATARYKAKVIYDLRFTDSGFTGRSQIVNRKSVNRKFIDLTGGLGVDFAFMAPLFSEAVYVERQQELCNIATHNFGVLGLQQVQVICADGVDYLHSLPEAGLGNGRTRTDTFFFRAHPCPSDAGGAAGTLPGQAKAEAERAALIFLDPARRDSHGGRTYGMADCTPNVLPLMDELLAKADRVMLKLSPMLDWRKAVNDAGTAHVEQVHIVATGGECKELLLLLSAQGSSEPQLFCVNDNSVEAFRLNGATGTTVAAESAGRQTPPPPQPLHSPQSAAFLYEPHAALMKAGVFAEIEARYGVKQVAPNSHLFTSQQIVEGFPGRTFRISCVCSMNKHELKQHIAPLHQANISVRNFPLTVAQLRQRLKLGEGGSNYLFATTLANGQKVLFVCH
jgi:hypothetical protein